MHRTRNSISSLEISDDNKRLQVIDAPVPDRRLGFVKVSYRSAAGLIKSEWRYKGNKWIWTFTIPAGCTATVTVPGEKPREYGEGRYTVSRTE